MLRRPVSAVTDALPIAYRDFTNWAETKKLSQFELHERAELAELSGESVAWLSHSNFRRWVDGDFHPWLRDSC
jgi:hypothetical protein